jgi:cyclase
LAEDRIQLEQVSESCVAAIDPRLGSNAAAAVLDDFIVCVDAGKSTHAARLLRSTLESTYGRPVRFTCVTHYHGDHTAGLNAFKDVGLVSSSLVADRLRDLPEWTRAEIKEWREEEARATGTAVDTEVVVPTLLFDDQVKIVSGRSLEFFHSGGHTSCSSYGYLAEEGVLFSGDLIFAGMFPFAGDATADPESWMATLRTWLTMDVETVIPGHGPVSEMDQVSKHLDFLETLKQSTLAVIERGRDAAAIAVPSTPPVLEEKSWFVAKTLARWHEYYSLASSES